MSNDINNKRKDLTEEYKLIQQKISNWDSYSLIIKNWAITIWIAIIVFISTQYYTQKESDIDLTILYLIPALLPILFWIFDGLFKYFQRLSVIRSQAIEDYLNNRLQKSNEKKTENLEEKKANNNKKSDENSTKNPELDNFVEKFPIYDIVSRISKTYPYFDKEYNKKTSFIACFLVRIVSTIYLIIMILTIIIASIISNNFWILLYLFIPSIILLISWLLSDKEII